MRGMVVSPLVASAGLIIATIIIAAFLANYVTSAIESESLKALECPENTTINYVSNDYPRFSGGRIEAVVEVSGNTLSGFVFNLTLSNSSVVSYPNKESQLLKAGTIGTLRTDVLPLNAPDIVSVVITTSCSNVATEPRSLR
ncbi:MAG: hypothetical protein KQA33_02390 [Candidatus Aenigmarchaeota archaeon]|nr:hypothetical protein [Candidatus Aenigmarchaeota archaeon]